MTAPSLTIGCATYRDDAGLYFTLESLHAHHPRVAYLVIDNAPESCTRSRGVTNAVGGRYLHRPDLHGTSSPRDALFRLATTDWVMCIDSHVLLETGAVQALLDYMAAHPDSNDLITGPLVYDDGKSVSTHWRPEAPPGLWGTWDTCWVAPNGRAFTASPQGGHRLAFADAFGRPLDPAEVGLSDYFLGDLATWLHAAGCTVGGAGTTEPFDIPMQGLGLFAMRRAAWPGFHPLFRGFGGEEGYIHEKVRQRGGRVLCLPQLRWRHRFRHMEHGAPPPPYPLRLEDHVWNLLVGHRELGVDALPQIRDHFGKRLPAGAFEQMVQASEKVQARGVPADRKRLKLLGVWYTNSQAPEKLLQSSLRTIQRAASETMFHDVRVATSAWRPVPGNPFPCAVGKPDTPAGHAAIVAQIRAALKLADDYEWDALVFLEHDVLYPPGHFDRVGNGLASGAPVASNLDYEGLNQTGWLKVKERHEPMHELAMRRDVALANLARAEEDCKRQGWALLEPDSGDGADRSAWVRLPVEGLAPAVHVNHEKRLTSHGEVCYEPTSNGRLIHPFWGRFEDWWPGEAKPDMGRQQKAGGCGACNKQAQGPPPAPIFPTVEAWFDAAAARPSDFHEHMPTLRDLAKGCEVVVELSAWLKPALLAMAAGRPKRLLSYCPGVKPEWGHLKQLLAPGAEFEGVQADGVAAEPVPHDLLFIDTQHRAGKLYAELERWAPHCRGRIVVHCVETFGEKGDDGGPGVLPALRRWTKEHPEWVVLRYDTNNHGLIVLSCDPADRKAVPGLARQAWNFTKAMAKHVAAGMTLLDEAAVEKRLDACALCPLRAGEQCSKCGCYLSERPDGGAGKAFFPKESCPIGKWHAEEEQAAA